MLRTIKTFIKDPEPVARFEEVELGLNVCDGLVRVAEPLRSPVRGQNCAAYFYQAYLMVTGTRSPMPMKHKIKEAVGYGAFTLLMEGGEVEVVPSRPPKLDQAAHLELARRYGTNFVGVETVVMPGAKVRVRGKVRKSDGRFMMTLKEITVLEKQVLTSGVVGDRKERRKRAK